MQPERAVSIAVEGRVQGVFFRKHVQEVAQQLGINGFVCNRNDGSVYIEACGNTVNIAQLIDWCHKGPPRASVTQVKVVDIDRVMEKGFEVRFTR